MKALTCARSRRVVLQQVRKDARACAVASNPISEPAMCLRER